MSIVEDRLSDAWSHLTAADTGGFRVTNWCSHLLSCVRDRYDHVIFDVGPSLGALNRTVILASDYVVTPFGCDIFSLLGIRNISTWIQNLDKMYKRAVVAAVEDKSQIFKLYNLIRDTENHFRFAGYSVQQYVTRKFKEGPRPVKSYERIISKIPDTVDEAMNFITPQSLTISNLQLGHIPFLYSLVPIAQSANTPIHALTGADGVVGSQYAQVKEYGKLMAQACEKLLSNVGLM
jgi:AAA domain